MRRVVGAAAKDHLALGAQLLHLAQARGLDANRSLALEEDAVDVHPRHHGEVLPLARRVQVGNGGAGSQAGALSQLVHANSVLLDAVEVLVAGQAGFDPGLDEPRGHGVA